ncbi:MAG TPA: alpha/beta fold hydrolase [Candidatus Eisenbacteria bacterium]|nr:alpha/beta fold hydrolase [Candidatus Eisenbacteria bacterium]
MWICFALVLLAEGARVSTTVAPGEILTVTATGSGSDVVFVPSLCGAAYGFREPTRAVAEAGYRAIVIEPLGFGHSSRPPTADYSLTAQSRRLAAVLDQIGTKDVILVAQGVSASIAFRLAVARPDLVRGIVSLEGGPAETGTTPAFRRAMGMSKLIEMLGAKKVLRSQLENKLRAASADASWVTNTVIDGYTEGAFENPSGTLAAFRAIATAHEPELIVPRLSQVHCPVELLVGAAPHEGGIPADELLALRQGLTQLRVVSISACGHFISEERPDAIVASIRRIHRHTGSGTTAALGASPTDSPEGR